MSNRPEPLSAAQQADIGAVVAAMRANGVCWKAIERELGMGRTQLWRCLRLSDGMQHLSRRMQHLSGCGAAAAAE